MDKGTAAFIMLFSILCSPAWGTEPPPAAEENMLSPCPSSPNCVSSQSEQKNRYVAPLTYEGSTADAREKLIAVLSAMKRTEIITAREGYLHAVCRSALFRFADDIEFLFDNDGKTIHVPVSYTHLTLPTN